ncbi:MAG: creatininase [Candidatus Poribacteria bacterium]|nr:MAG: creatininase [Candidatus Poribacteria bacterium]
MYLVELTWNELVELSRERVVLLPWGALEQHGRHLPLGTDLFLLEAICSRLEAQCGELLLTGPVLRPSDSARHLSYPGTVSLPPETALAPLLETARALVGIGFQRLLILNGQYGNRFLVELALRELRQRHSGVSAVGLSYWDLLPEEERSEDHAGALETALMLHLFPDRVRKGQIVPDGLQLASPYASRVLHYLRTDQRSRSGGWGDPTCATADQGRKWLQTILEHLERLIRDLIDGRLTV